jgi:hypothetical protein
MRERLARDEPLRQPRGAPAVSIRQHTSAYASIRQHTSAYVEYVSIRQHMPAYVEWGMDSRAPAVSIRQHESAYVSRRQHTSAYVSIRRMRERLARDEPLRQPRGAVESTPQVTCFTGTKVQILTRVTSRCDSREALSKVHRRLLALLVQKYKY